MKLDFFQLKKINRDRWLDFLFLLLVFAVFLSNYGYEVADQNEQNPVILRMMDSGYLKNDWFTNANDGFSARYYYSFVLVYLSNFADLSTVFFSVYVVSLLVIMVSIYLLSNLVFRNSLASLLTVSLILFAPNTSLGGTWIVSSYLAPTTIAMAFALPGIYLFMRGHLCAPFLLFGIASLFQVLVGLLVAAIMLLTYVSLGGINLRKLSLSTVSYLIFGLWSILPMAMVSSSQNASSLEAMNIIGFVRHPWHYNPLQFNVLSYLAFASVMCLFIVAFKNNPSPINRVNKTVTSSLLLIGIIGITGTLFVEFLPIPQIHNLQLLRTTPFAVLFAYIYLTNYITAKAKIFHWNNFATAMIMITVLIVILTSVFYNIDHNNEIKEAQKPKADAYEWIKTNTPEEAIFIIPPYIEDFRLGAERAIVVDFKGFTYNSIYEWRERIRDTTNNVESKFRGNRLEEVRTGFESLNEQDFLRISEKYQAKYILIEKPKKLGFPSIYENGGFIIYMVPRTYLRNP